MIADSFASEFPHVTVWIGKARFHRTVLALIGSNEPLVFDATAVDARLEQLFAGRSFDRELSDATRVARLFVGCWHARPAAVLNTDERPRLEFSMPLTYANQQTLARTRMHRYYDQVLSKLPSEGVEFDGGPDAATSHATRRKWQRLQLRKW